MSGREQGAWELVYEAKNHAEAGLVKGLLESEGLIVMSRGKYGVPHLGGGEPIMLMVPEDQAGQASELIAAYLDTPQPQVLEGEPQGA